MSAGRAMTNLELRQEGWKALTERLGVAGAMRFMMQYDTGCGDYTRERRDLFADLDMDEALRRLGMS